MTMKLRVFPRRGLVFFSAHGRLTASAMIGACRLCLRHPDFRPGQKQLFDLTEVTGFDCSASGLLSLQAKQLDLFAWDGAETLIVYHAPHRAAQDIAQRVLRPRGSMKGVIPRIQEHEADALSLLGQPETSFADFLAMADQPCSAPPQPSPGRSTGYAPTRRGRHPDTH
ncbi:hypothetical protein [Marinibacterium profundimaris]|uniref:hypothetical protein n=1 Tax=Marinibacterium profundimaris TaxID=1679460 RepID=UPI000B525F6C|nr:hypothetical protein [Marinibacterium profundimaris]